MSATFILMELAGDVVLLLWGARMVQRGIERAFGSDLRRALGRALRNRFVAFAAGTFVTMLLQSSTATAIMVSSFAARGVVDLIPALAVMLGANVGTAVIVKALGFDLSWIAPLLLLAGYAGFRSGPKGRFKDLGRVGVGLGLMLTALHLLVETMRPVGASPRLESMLSALTADPVLDLLLAAALTVAAHSSVAIMLMLAGLSASGAVTPAAAIALTLGANLGGALSPALETDAAIPSSRRAPFGNLMFRFIACAAALPFAHSLAAIFWGQGAAPKAAVTNFHLAFNMAAAVAWIGLLGPASAVLTAIFPDKRETQARTAHASFLEPEALATPYLALANAAREILRVGDLLEELLGLVPAAWARREKSSVERVRSIGRELDSMHDAVKAYLAALNRADLTARDLTRLSDLVEFAINLGHAGDILERVVSFAPTNPAGALSDLDRDAVARMHARATADLRLALSTMMTEDERSAQELLAAKREVNEFERAAARAHIARLHGADAMALAASSLFLALLRDLRRANSHFATIGYAVISSAEPLQSASLSGSPRPEMG